MTKIATIFGTLLISMTAVAGTADLQIFKTLTDLGVATNLSASSDTKIMEVNSIQCREVEGSLECLVDDASNYGFQRTFTGADAKIVSDLITKVMNSSPVFGFQDSSKLQIVSNLICAQFGKGENTMEEMTSCYGRVVFTPEGRYLDWGDLRDANNLLRK